MNTNIINKFGTLMGWGAVTFNMMGRDVDGITELEYEDSMEINNEYGAGNMPVGESQGNYSAKGSISVLMEEHIALLRSLPKGTRIQDVLIPAIPVVYGLSDVQTIDVLNNVRIMGSGRSIKQGDGKVIMKYELKISHIDWNV
ncbi:MAG TPA: hypothetical protein P5531_10560 [Bacteroidales bacterium]|nr:hypothetical protein [Bacteroidales bacterium]HSA43596.1 hypothetical protein [Bacteroidales bacterium]